eukprot:CAMPEP_0170587442 /NCGR_PEP_ID=MMETSP0224-20130122/10286_1 /TAXON_ID=285029 /ORGANISM="Togula jolla, Strain CCCM 725" /LENGTH=36 /DNA_ID= /DNA_START= /DNA_END= /DNA_ORIENTATION=
MTSLLDDESVFHHYDLVSMLDSAQPVRDDQNCAILL